MKKTPSTRSAVTMPTMFSWSRAARSRGSWRSSPSSPVCRWGTLMATFLSIQTSLARKTVPKPPEPRLERIWYFPTVCPRRNMERPEYSSATALSGANRADESRAAPARALPGVVAWGLLPAAVGVHLLAARAPALVERLYARGLYPAVAAALSWLTGWVPFSLAELLLGAAVVLAVWVTVAFARRLARSAGRRGRVVA